jgi:hypothetical protein
MFARFVETRASSTVLVGAKMVNSPLGGRVSLPLAMTVWSTVAEEVNPALRRDSRMLCSALGGGMPCARTASSMRMNAARQNITTPRRCAISISLE